MKTHRILTLACLYQLQEELLREIRVTQDVVKIINERGFGLTRGVLTESDIKALTMDTILDRLHNVFKNVQVKYNIQHKAFTEQEVTKWMIRKLRRKLRVIDIIHCINKNIYSHFSICRRRRSDQRFGIKSQPSKRKSSIGCSKTSTRVARIVSMMR